MQPLNSSGNHEVITALVSKFNEIIHESTDNYESYRLYEIIAALQQVAASNYQRPLNLNAISILSDFKENPLLNDNIQAGIAVLKQILISVSTYPQATKSLLTARQPIEYIIRLKDLFQEFPQLVNGQSVNRMPIVLILHPIELSNKRRKAILNGFQNAKMCFTKEGKLYSKKYQTTQNISMELYSTILLASNPVSFSSHPIHLGDTGTGEKIYKVYKNPGNFNLYTVDRFPSASGSCAEIYFGYKLLNGKPIAIKESKLERKYSENVRKECFNLLGLIQKVRNRQAELKSRFPECFRLRLKKGCEVEEQAVFLDRPIFFEEESDRMAVRRYSSDSSKVRVALPRSAQVKADLLKKEFNKLRNVCLKEAPLQHQLKCIEKRNGNSKTEDQIAFEKLEISRLRRDIVKFREEKDKLRKKIAVLKQSYESELANVVKEHPFAIKQMQKNLFSFCQNEIARMAALHDLHVAHCDYKTKNVLVDRSHGQNNPVIADVADMIYLKNPTETPNLHRGEQLLPIRTMTPTTTSLRILKEMHQVVLEGKRAPYNWMVLKHDMNSLATTLYHRLTASEVACDCDFTEFGAGVRVANVMNLSDIKGNPLFQLLPEEMQDIICEMLMESAPETLEEALAIFRAHTTKKTVE